MALSMFSVKTIMPPKAPSKTHQICAWFVHIFTASTAVVGVATLHCINQQQFIAALWLMAIAIFIDAIDGTLARLVRVKSVLPAIDGALLDNICDFLNYVITPCFFLLVVPHLLPENYRWLVVSLICLSSCFQFTQSDAKTADHFFKGFPSYWNIVVFYLFLFSHTPMINVVILLSLCVLVFVPIKYVYPSRLDYLTTVLWLRKAMLFASVLYGVDCLLLLYTYPNHSHLLIVYNLLYVGFYLGASIFRTCVPLIKLKLQHKSTLRGG